MKRIKRFTNEWRMGRGIVIFLCLATLLVVVYSCTARNNDLESWAQNAPRVQVMVGANQSGWELVRDQLPPSVRDNDPVIANALNAVEAATGQDLDHVDQGEYVELPVPYEEWEALK